MNSGINAGTGTQDQEKAEHHKDVKLTLNTQT
jgi:hypothetical protein